MAERRRFLERVKGFSDAETLWLQQLFDFVREHLGPAPSEDSPAPSEDSPAPSVSELSLDLVRILQENSASRALPVSYSLVSVASLASLQRVPCVSRLSWSTEQHRASVREAEQIPGLRPLPRVKLLLIGRLCRGRGPDLKLRDASGELSCQSQVSLWSVSPDRVLFLPHWNYIPHDAPGRGLLELVAPPLPLCPAPRQREGAGLGPALSVHQAATFLLQHRSRGRGSAGSGLRGGRVSVKGVVSAVCPLLDIGGTSFFILCLRQSSSEVHVVVKDGSCRLWWSRAVHVGMSVHVTELRACTLRSWSGNSVLSATDQSELTVVQTDPAEPGASHTGQSEPGVALTGQSELGVALIGQSELGVALTGQSEPGAALTGQSEPGASHTGQSEPGASHTGQSEPGASHTGQSEPGAALTGQSEPDVQQTDQSQLHFEEAETMDQSEAMGEDQSELRASSVISYQGAVTQVLSRGAGLYVIDRKVGLCLANQPPPSRALRPGDVVQVCNVHVLLRPSPAHSPIMLCCCLRSSVTVTAFSPGYSGDREEEERCPGDGVLPRLLLEKDVGVAEYLWMCHVTSRLRDSLASRGQQCVCLLSWRILQSVFPKPRSPHRDIYREMMDSPHSCRLTQAGPAPSLPHVLSVAELRSRLLSLCWSSLRLRSLLPPDGQSLNCAQLNAALSWSRLRLQSERRDHDTPPGEGEELLTGRRPLLVVGLLELPAEGSEAQTLQLRDSSGSISCVATEEQSAPFSTAWIGCLVCVRSFSMVTERFIQSEFPSYEHLEQERFVTQRDARVYLQFSLVQVTVLSPSVSMTIQLRQEAESEQRKRQKLQDEEEGGGARACVSVVIRAGQKEGVARRNVGAGSELAFTLRAAAIGPVVAWGRDPKNRPIAERELVPLEEKGLTLSFCGAPCRWFPMLQRGRFYRLVALDAEDPSVLIGCAVAGQTGVELHADSALQVRPDWRIHSVPRPLAAAPESCDLSSISDVINSRADLVSFQGLVLERVGVADRSQDSAHTGTRLTVCDSDGRSLHVYLDLSHAPFTPGLLPGNSLMFSRVQRRVSRSGAVYCSSVPVSCVSVVSIGQSSAPAPPPFPMMLLGQWGEGGGVSVARVRGHVVCVLFVQLQWSCSRCERVFSSASCSSAQCGSASSVFQAKAKAVLDDGSAEAHVTFYNPLVQTLLRLDDSQWAGLQRALRVKGHVQAQPRGRGLSTQVGGRDLDPLQTLLLCLCAEALIGSFSLTCRLQRSPRCTELRRVIRGDRDFMTHTPRPLQLTCLHLEPTNQRAAHLERS